MGKPRFDSTFESSESTPRTTRSAILLVEWLASFDTFSYAARINIMDLSYDCGVVFFFYFFFGMIALHGVYFDGLAQLVFKRLLLLPNGERRQDKGAELGLNDLNMVQRQP